MSDKTYFKITAMSEAFRTWAAYADEQMTTDTTAEIAEIAGILRTDALIWQAKAQMALVQQVSLMAFHLKEMEEQFSILAAAVKNGK